MKICCVMRRTVNLPGLSARHLGKVPGLTQTFFERRISHRDIPLALIDLKAAFVREGELPYATIQVQDLFGMVRHSWSRGDFTIG
jgi:hypothetical protein